MGKNMGSSQMSNGEKEILAVIVLLLVAVANLPTLSRWVAPFTVNSSELPSPSSRNSSLPKVANSIWI
jgi:hypothetical protein